MRSWLIIVASAVAATIAGAFLFLPGGMPSRAGLAVLLAVQWPAVAVVWLGLYGAVAFVLTTLVATIASGGAPSRWSGQGRAWGYLVRLAATQYVTSVLALLALGLSRVPVEPAPFVSLPAPIAASPAFAACGGLVLVGLLGWLSVAAAFRGRRSAAPAADGPELRLLREAVELLRAQTPGAAMPGTDVAQLIEAIERGHQSVLEVVKDLATAVNRLRRGVRQGLEEIKTALREQGAERPLGAGPVPPSATEDAAVQLRAIVEALDIAVARLAQITALPSGHEPLPGTHRRAPTTPLSRSQLSSELQELLREMTPTAPRDPPG